jgi:hypothetical protein
MSQLILGSRALVPIPALLITSSGPEDFPQTQVHQAAWEVGAGRARSQSSPFTSIRGAVLGLTWEKQDKNNKMPSAIFFNVLNAILRQ